MTSADSSLIGTWRMVRWGTRSESTGEVEPFADADGRIIYLANGFMSAHLARPHPTDHDTLQTASYSGTWSSNGETAWHNVDLARIPVWVGTTVVRKILLLDADNLHLETPANVSPWEAEPHVLEWTREEDCAG